MSKRAISLHGYDLVNIGAGYWRCTFCRAALHEADRAAHVLDRHPARPLVGQLAIPDCGVKEVTR